MANEQESPINYLEDRRLALHGILCGVVGDNKKVYYQPPESIKVSYPCIIYELDNINISPANNKVYNRNFRFRVTVVDIDPSSNIADALSKRFASIRFIRHYNSDGLNHFVFTINY